MKRLMFFMFALILCLCACGEVAPTYVDDVQDSSSSSWQLTSSSSSPNVNDVPESSSSVTAESSSATLKTRVVPYEQVKVTKECSVMTLTVADITKKYKEYYDEWERLACVGERVGEMCVRYDNDLTLDKTVCRNSYEDDVQCKVTYMFLFDNDPYGALGVSHEDKDGKLDSAAVIRMMTLKYPSAKLDTVFRYCTQTYLE